MPTETGLRGLARLQAGLDVGAARARAVVGGCGPCPDAHRPPWGRRLLRDDRAVVDEPDRNQVRVGPQVLVVVLEAVARGPRRQQLEQLAGERRASPQLALGSGFSARRTMSLIAFGIFGFLRRGAVTSSPRDKRARSAGAGVS